jgi:NTP pyrophosphatase (non-canonical NTP hydrolase)
MNFTEYQQKAMAFRLPTADAMYALLNLGAEAGEVLSLEAKLIRDGGSIDEYRRKLKKELGDVLWHVAAIAKDNGMDLHEVAVGNIHKLAERQTNNTIQGNGDDR